jgi:hypothetical protein
MHDLASVLMTVRSFSNSVRWKAATVSSNVRQKQAMIARRAVHHCASLHLIVGSSIRFARLASSRRHATRNAPPGSYCDAAAVTRLADGSTDRI